jgi:hypothetical protein
MLEYLPHFLLTTGVIADNLETLTCLAGSNGVSHVDLKGKIRRVILPAPVIAAAYVGSYHSGDSEHSWLVLCNNGLEYDLGPYSPAVYPVEGRPDVEPYVMKRVHWSVAVSARPGLMCYL